MDYRTNTRNLTDGTMIVYDDNVVNSLTLALDEGDLRWTVTQNDRNVLDRGSLDHVRAGDEQPVTGEFSVKLTQFYGANTDGQTLYEIALNRSALSWSSVGNTGEPHMLGLQFKIAAPGTDEAETIDFDRVRFNTVEPQEGDEYSTLRVTFTAYETEPTVSSSSAT